LNSYRSFADIGPFKQDFENKKESLKYSLDIENIYLKDDNDPESKTKKHDVKEKVLMLEDIDPDS